MIKNIYLLRENPFKSLIKIELETVFNSRY